ncbi:MAG: methionine gamma-lyase family protein [Eubacteriaceae bacterium]|nr:methionine gamma-lyase family protein [Eubacteriaceae bacterium]
MQQSDLIAGEIKSCEDELRSAFGEISEIAYMNQIKVIKAMQDAGLSERHFAMGTGYGYGDEGRDATEEIFARAFGAEKAIVRPQIASGTHAIAIGLYGLLRPGDELLSATSSPYETIGAFIGANGENSGYGTLADFGVKYRQIEFLDGYPDIELIRNSVGAQTKAVFVQRSTGYSERSALTLNAISDIAKAAHASNPNACIFVDNCYGEFINAKEPLDAGADIIAGSLIKNPGGGLALTGGYIAGKQAFLGLIAARLTAPGIGDEVGANMGMVRHMLQGLFLAPRTVADALKGAVLTARVFENRGYRAFPSSTEERSDIIQAIALGSPEKVIAYCKAIQSASPVDAYASPEPQELPGYKSPVIMAAGNFVQGSSIELSADAPMREPYIVYQQGGLTYEHVKFGLCSALLSLDSI